MVEYLIEGVPPRRLFFSSSCGGFDHEKANVGSRIGGRGRAGGRRSRGRLSQQEAPKIEPKADQYLKAMSSYLAGLKTYSFQVEEFFDEVQDDGQKIQLSNQRHLSVSRPDKVFGEDEGDTANSLFYYDGKTVTVYDRGQKTYATEKVPGTIDAMLDDLHDRFDTRPDPGRLPVCRPLQGVHGTRAERDVCRVAPRGQGEVPSPGVPAEDCWTGKSGSTPATSRCRASS